MAKERHARLFYLSRALDHLGVLTSAADHWLSPEACDALTNELEPLVRSMAERIKARVPDLVLPFTLDDDDRINEVVENETRSLEESLARLNRIRGLSQPVEEVRRG